MASVPVADSSHLNGHSDVDKFYAAVKIINNLPKDGPFQASNDMKLRFYAFFKQATKGKCEDAKPGFWDVVGRAKWEAWHSLGDMSPEDAMQGYVDQLKQIIGTMSLDRNVQEFLQNYSVFDDDERKNGDESTVPNGHIRDGSKPDFQSMTDTNKASLRPTITPKAITNGHIYNGNDSNGLNNGHLNGEDSMDESELNGHLNSNKNDKVQFSGQVLPVVKTVNSRIEAGPSSAAFESAPSEEEENFADADDQLHTTTVQTDCTQIGEPTESSTSTPTPSAEFSRQHLSSLRHYSFKKYESDTNQAVVTLFSLKFS